MTSSSQISLRPKLEHKNLYISPWNFIKVGQGISKHFIGAKPYMVGTKPHHLRRLAPAKHTWLPQSACSFLQKLTHSYCSILRSTITCFATIHFRSKNKFPICSALLREKWKAWEDLSFEASRSWCNNRVLSSTPMMMWQSNSLAAVPGAKVSCNASAACMTRRPQSVQRSMTWQSSAHAWYNSVLTCSWHKHPANVTHFSSATWLKQRSIDWTPFVKRSHLPHQIFSRHLQYPAENHVLH